MRTIGPAGTFLILLGVLAAVPVQAQTPPGICDRTQQVQDGILNWLSGVSDCAEVTTTHLTTVTELTLESVGLTSLRADDFAGLTELKELRLTGNYQLYRLPSGVFSGLAKLETLDLYNNQFYQGLPAGVFSGLTNLETLNLGANRIPDLRAEAFSGLSALETLNLGNNRITALPAGVFSGLTNLETLSLSDILITALPAGVFSGLSALKTLNLGGNDLTEVPAEVFSDMSALKTLILRWNQIGSVPDGAFSDLPNLEKLDLFSNLITALPSGAFSGLTKLKVLMAGSNQLVALPDGVFAGLTMLDTLDVAENPVHPLLLTVTVEMAGSDRVRAKVPAGAPFAMSLPVSVTNGGLAGGASTLEITAGAVVGEAVAVTRTEGTTEAVMVDLGTPLPSPPMGTHPPYRHRGYAFVRAPSDLPVKILSPARVRNVRVVNGPGSDGVWSTGERVELEVRYSLPVVVRQPRYWVNADGDRYPPGPFLMASFRSDERPGYGRVLSTPLAPYVGELGGSGTRVLRFAYTVGAAEDGARGVVAADNGLLLRGATIRTLEGGEGASRYTITRVMQVDVRTPSRAAWAAGEKVRVRVRFTGPPQPYTPDTPPEERLNWDKVDVAGGTPTIRLLLGDRERRTRARTASYVGGSGTNTLVFEYEVRAGDGRVGAVEVVAGSLASNGATIRNERGYDAELGHLSAVRYAQRPALSVADAEATEGEDATLDFVVKLDGNSGSEVKVDYRTRDGTAEAGFDYTETRGRLTFAPGEYEKTVSVPIRDDAVEDNGETFKLLLSNVSGAGVANDDYEATGTIEDVAPEVPSGGLTASFEGMPAKHNAKNAFTFRVAFSEDTGISFRALREDAFTVSGGRVTDGKRVDGRRDLFEMTVRPESDGDVTITLPAGRACSVSGAICTKGENRHKLTNAPSARVRGPAAAAQEPQQQQRPDQAAAAAQEPQQQEQKQQPQEEEEEEEQPQKPPAAPRNLTGVANDDGSVTLSWDTPGDDSVTGYRILRRHTVKQAPGVFSTLAANTGTTATTYTDRVASPETRYAYRVKAVNAAGAGKRSNYVNVTTKRAAPASKPAVADGPPGLAPNAPNPFNPSTVIPYRLDTDGPVRLDIYNLLGQRIRTLVNEAQAAGAYRVRWDARDATGRSVATGVYFIRLHHPGGVHIRRMLYLK